ncbi:MAG: hypothetical protein ACQPRH_02025 [Solitalea-like symbiont of Tyrophagus putrescentiae]
MSINNISIKDLVNADLKSQYKVAKKLPKHIKIKNTTIGDFMYEKSISIKVLIVYVILSLICAAIIFILYNL